MENTGVEVGAGSVEREPLIDPIPPAPAADDQKSDIPGSAEENEKSPEEAKPDETPEQTEAKKQSRRQRQLTREKVARVAAETETRLLREQLAAERAKSGAPQEPVEPKRESFPDYESYLDARTEFKANQVADARIKAEREAQGKQPQQSPDQQKLSRDWTDREKAFQSTTKDYVDVVTPFIEEDLGQLSDAGRRAILESEKGPQLLFHLAQNDDLVAELAELSPRDQRTELTKLAATLDVPTRKASNAPPPLKPVPSGKNGAGQITGNESQAEYEAKRKSQGAKWAR